MHSGQSWNHIPTNNKNRLSRLYAMCITNRVKGKKVLNLKVRKGNGSWRKETGRAWREERESRCNKIPFQLKNFLKNNWFWVKKSDTSLWTLNRPIAFNLVSYLFLFKCHRLRISIGTKDKGRPLSLRVMVLAFIVFPFLMVFLFFTLSPHPEQCNLSIWLDFSNSNSPAVVMRHFRTLVSGKEISILLAWNGKVLFLLVAEFSLLLNILVCL